MIQTMFVVTLTVFLGKPLQYVLCWCRSPGFSKRRELWLSKAAFTITFFAGVNHRYDPKQRTLKHRNSPNGSKSINHKSQTMTLWTRWSKLLFLRGPLRWLASDIFLTRGSKCTNKRKTILIACFLRGHLNIIQWGTIWISFDPKFFKAAGRSSLEEIWRPCYEERCQYNVEVCFRALNLQMHTLFAVGSHWKMTLSVFGMGWSANSKKNKRNCQDIQWRQILHRRNDKSEYQDCTSKIEFN